MPRWLIAMSLMYLALLIFTALAYGKIETFKIHGLDIPTSVIWFGALGGVITSLQGIFAYNKKWDHSYTIWHVFAGVVGAVYGLASYLFLVVIIKSADGSIQPINAPVFALAALAIGYSQSKFHSMMDQVFSIIFRPARSSSNDPKKSAKSQD